MKNSEDDGIHKSEKASLPGTHRLHDPAAAAAQQNGADSGYSYSPNDKDQYQPIRPCWTNEIP